MSGKRVFITGGAGFIGSHLVKVLENEADTVVVYDNLLAQVHGNDAKLPVFPDNVRFVLGDVRDEETLQHTVSSAQPDTVYHLAAETGTGQSQEQITRYCDVNVGGTSRLIEALRNLQEPPRRVILAGTRAVYGEGAYRNAEGVRVVPPPRTVETMRAGHFAPRDSAGRLLEPIKTTEDTPVSPSSVYATTKLAQEYLLAQGFEETDVETTVLRFQNVYGPGQSLQNPYTGVLSIFVSQILANQKLNIYEDGDITRDFVFVDDVVASLRLAGKAEVPSGTIVNIGSGQAATIHDIARRLLRILGRSGDELEITGDFRPGDIRHAVADAQRANSILGWRATTSLEEGLGKLVSWATAEAG